MKYITHECENLLVIETTNKEYSRGKRIIYIFIKIFYFFTFFLAFVELYFTITIMAMCERVILCDNFFQVYFFFTFMCSTLY